MPLKRTSTRARRLLLSGSTAIVLALSGLGAATVLAADTIWVSHNVPSSPGTGCAKPDFVTIQAAVDAAAPGDTIRVCAGLYPENVRVDVDVTLKGARAGHPFPGRTFAGPAESTVTGSISIEASGVTFDGFSVTNPGQGLGIVVRTAGNNALIVNNIVGFIGSSTFAENTVGIYLEYGPDRVTVLGNWIKNIESVPSAQGILVGDSTSANPSLNTLLAANLIEDVTSTTRGAYGIQINNGASLDAVATGYTTGAVLANKIRNLTGAGWTHAIGLEGDTPKLLVTGNSISNILAGTTNRVAVFLENNPSDGTVHIIYNNFDVTPAAAGIFVVPTTGPTVDGQCNWWGSADGPGPLGTGHGAAVGPRVDYTPWLTASALRGRCNGGSGHGGGH